MLRGEGAEGKIESSTERLRCPRVGVHDCRMSDEAAAPSSPWLGTRFWLLGAVFLGLLLVAWVALNKGPTSILRWAVRSYDPALRLQAGRTNFRDGEWVLRDLRLFMHGQKEPLLTLKEARVGLGRQWIRGQIGSLTLIEPFIRLHPPAVEYLSQNSSDGGFEFAWGIGEVTVERGHLWAENFGESGVDVSAGIEGKLRQLGPAHPGEKHELVIGNFYLASHNPSGSLPVMGAGQCLLSFTLGGWEAGRVASLRVDDGWMIAGEGLERLLVAESSDADQEHGAALVFDSVELVNLQVQPDGLPGGLPAVSLQVNTALRDVPFGAVAEELADNRHQIEFSDIELLSPTDPLRRAVTVRSAFVIFTLAGLARHDLEEIKLIGPTVYVGEPLFEYMDVSDEKVKEATPVEVAEEWNVKNLSVNFGRVVLAVGGRSKVGLPLSFHTQVSNLSLTSLAGLNVEFVLKVPEEDYDFPAYDLSLSKVSGDLLFNYPPDLLRNNLVNVVKFGRARWRNFHARDLWISATFDQAGINGDFGGRPYRGYVNGGFSFLFQPESPWTGWITGEGLDLDLLTADGAPQHFVMDGLADFKVEVNGKANVVERVKGEMVGRGGGRLVVNKLNDMLEALPPEWPALKSELSRVSLETLRDFNYTEAKSEFWFVGKQGIIDIRMKGPAGSRNFELVFHGDDAERKGAWQRGGRR